MKFPHQDPIEDKLNQFKEIVDESVFKDWHVTEQMKASLLERINQQPSRTVVPYSKRMNSRLAAGTIAACIAVGLFIAIPWNSADKDRIQSSFSSSSASQTAQTGLSKYTASNDGNTTDSLNQVRNIDSSSDEYEVRMLEKKSASISSRHNGPGEIEIESGTNISPKVQSTSQQSSKQDSQASSNKTQQPVDTKQSNDLKHSNTQKVSITNSDSTGVTTSGLVADLSQATPAAVGPMVASSQVNNSSGTIDATEKLQTLRKLTNGYTIILSAQHDGVYDVYEIPQDKFSIGWLSQGQIGVYVLPAWKLPIQLTSEEADYVRQSSALSIYSAYPAIEVAMIPIHAPYTNQDDPIRDRLVQLSQQHQLYAIQVPDGSVAFFSANHKGTMPASSSINKLPSPDYTFIARISDPALYCYPIAASGSWSTLQSGIQWIVSSPQAITSINTTLMSYPLYP